jgi:hypothetical protein
VNEHSETASPAAQTRTGSVPSAWDLLLAAGSADAAGSDLARLRFLLERALSERTFDWDGLRRLADENGTSSLLYLNLSRLTDLVPAPTLAALRQRYESNVHKSLFLARELIRILDCLATRGIAAIPYKGIVLSELYYGDMALRQPGDLDLFVRRHDVARTKIAVRELGYTERVPIPPEAEEDFIASGYECSFDSAAGPALLELQWALQPRFYAVDFDMEGLWARAVSVEVAGRAVKTPSPEDLLLILSVHAAKHVWGRLIWSCDIAQILRRENLNWDEVKLRAREVGIERILHVTLLLSESLLSAPIPTGIAESIRADRAARKFAEQITASLAGGVSYDVQQLPYFRLMMSLRERRVDSLRFLSRLTFTPGPSEWETVRLPKFLFPLYRVVRLARLVGRMGR